MQYKIIFAALAASPLVAAHGKVSVIQGDAGGNGTGLGILGGVVPGAGRNDKTEVDTTIFGSTDIATDGLGRTEENGRNTVSMVADSMAASGQMLPQVSANGGYVAGTLHIVTTDGAGPFRAMVDSTGTGAFSQGQEAEIATQVPGHRGNIFPDGEVPGGNNGNGNGGGNGLLRRMLLSRSPLVKRAANVNKDYPIKVNIPAGTTCSGTAGGQNNVCLLKIANSNPAGPFGGVIAFQIAAANGTAAAAAPAASGSADAAGASTAATGTGAAAGANEDAKKGKKGKKGGAAGAANGAGANAGAGNAGGNAGAGNAGGNAGANAGQANQDGANTAPALNSPGNAGQGNQGGNGGANALAALLGGGNDDN